MITRDEWKKFMDVLTEMPNISIASKRTGIGRNTYYARRRNDYEFAEMADQALELGREAGNDLAESVVFSQMRKGNLKAAEFQLKHNCPRYGGSVSAKKNVDSDKDPIGEATIEFVDFSDGTKSDDPNKPVDE